MIGISEIEDNSYMVNTDLLKAKLQRYDIQERLGSGGMATVYRAVDKNLQRDVALKVMHDHLSHDETFRERFEREARFIASFNHPNIVQVYDFAMVDCANSSDIFYMVMPYLPGDTLVDVLNGCRTKEETLPHNRILDIVTDLAAALDYAYERGMIHRDVKPANIIFDENDYAILTDFGIARLAKTSGLTQDGTIIGTPAYMSPEQATGQEIDHRSDIYSLGIITYELLSGRPPFEDDGTVSVLLKHAQEIPAPISDHMEFDNYALDDVLERVLAKNPNDRYQKASFFAEALKSAIEHESTEQRFKPATISNRPDTRQPNATVAFEKPKNKNSDGNTGLTHVLQTTVLQPAKQNPFGVAGFVLALVALLIIARTMQSVPSQPAPVAEPTNIAPTEMVMGSMVIDKLYFDTEFEDEDVNDLWQTSNTSEVRQITEGQYLVSNEREGVAMTALLDPTYEYENVNIVTTATLLESSADPNSGYGVVFRYLNPNNYNVFAVDGMGRYSIWVREDGQWRELRDADESWTRSDIINPIGEPNTIDLNIYNDSITVYVNDEFLLMLDEDTIQLGGVGIYMATTRNGAATVAVDNYSVQPGMNTADSMTGEDTADSMTGEDTADSMTGEDETGE